MHTDTHTQTQTQTDTQRLEAVRRELSAKGPDSSCGGVPMVYCPDDDKMEEEVQVRVQV